MDNKLLHDTLHLLHEHIDAHAAFDLRIEESAVKEIVNLCNAYNLDYARKITVLACFMLIYAAIRKHQELIPEDEMMLGRSILDGDYLLGLYHKLAAGRREINLLMHLSLFHKRMQLALTNANGAPALYQDLKNELKSYLDKFCA